MPIRKRTDGRDGPALPPKYDRERALRSALHHAIRDRKAFIGCHAHIGDADLPDNWRKDLERDEKLIAYWEWLLTQERIVE